MEPENSPLADDAGGFIAFVDSVPAIAWIALISAVIAIWGVITQRAIARRRSTLDYITRQESDGDIIDARKAFVAAAKEDGGLAKWADVTNEKSETTQHIRITLNEFELISIGIQKGIIDFEMYRRWNKSGTIRYWNNAAPFIFALRARLDNDAIYHEYEQLVHWLKDNHMPRRSRWIGYLF